MMKTLLLICLAAMLDVLPAGDAFLRPLQQRDSVLIADQFSYGFSLDGVQGCEIALPDLEDRFSDTLVLVRNWQIDTIRSKKGQIDIEASMVVAPFEEGTYHFGDLYALRKSADGRVDTLRFNAPEPLEVKTMPVDTATFVINDLKGQIGYPLTFKEVAPWIGGALLVVALVFALVMLIRRLSSRKGAAKEVVEPAHVVALRELDRYRSDKYWAPDKQKTFYSGITDALKSYIDASFSIDAPEMTTADLFAALKGRKELTPELYSSLKELFERADFVKFAKYTVEDDKLNAAALPLCVRFVTDTYQAGLKEEANDNEL